jgi:hypothetical protein
MKKMLFSMFLLVAITCNAQIPKKANTITIAGNSSQADNFKQVNTTLFENGYGILNSDKELGLITTTEKSFIDGAIKLNILVKDNKVLIRGDYKMSVSINIGAGATIDPTWSTILFTGMKGSPAKDAWIEMSKLADAIPGDKEYLIK